MQFNRRMYPFIITPFLVCTLLLSTTLAKVPLHFTDARDFFHELGDKAMLFIFYKMVLNAKTAQILAQLVADDKLNIQKYYQETCPSISMNRASELLWLVKDHKNFEMHLLGPACLSESIIKARRAFPEMWPPSGFPLLIREFKPKEIDIVSIKDILGEALNQPEWWQSSHWINEVKWDEMSDDLRFWRMIPIKNCLTSKVFRPYIIKALFQIKDQPTCQDLEELFMKSIRISIPNNQALKKKLYKTIPLDKFSHLQDPWSIKVLTILKQMYSEGWRDKYFPRIILDSGLLQLASWQNSPIHIATNDIFELSLKALYTSSVANEMKEIKQVFILFLDDIMDWSSVRPVVFGEAIDKTSQQYFGSAFFNKYIDKMLTNPNALAILGHSKLLRFSTRLHAHVYNIKVNIGSLRSTFRWKGLNLARPILSPYTRLLYTEWKRNKRNWPGFIVAHERMCERVRGVFRRTKDGAYDPRTDEEYDEDTWRIAFASIRFDVEYGIRSKVIPSLCFLRALSYYHIKESTERCWVEIREKIGHECTLPEGKEESIRYRVALKMAFFVLVYRSPYLPIAHADFLQALIRGDRNEGTGEGVDGLAGNVGKLVLY